MKNGANLDKKGVRLDNKKMWNWIKIVHLKRCEIGQKRCENGKKRCVIGQPKGVRLDKNHSRKKV